MSVLLTHTFFNNFTVILELYILNNTRLGHLIFFYLTVENWNRKVGISFYHFNAKAFQPYSFDVDYPEIPSDIPPGVEENDVVLFEQVDYKTQSI